VTKGKGIFRLDEAVQVHRAVNKGEYGEKYQESHFFSTPFSMSEHDNSIKKNKDILFQQYFLVEDDIKKPGFTSN